MPNISPKYCLLCIDNRNGCLINAFIETCWLIISFVYSLQGLLKAANEWIMHIDFYREEDTDIGKKDPYITILKG